MATREDVYTKFGLTAEAAQLFETELGTLLLSARGLKQGWHVKADPLGGQKLLKEINRSTLGRLLQSLQQHAGLDDGLTEKFASALNARNRLSHGFFEKHNFRIDSDEGRDLMIADLETLHTELFAAWQAAGAAAKLTIDVLLKERGSSMNS
jgi:hypothetical protein